MKKNLFLLGMLILAFGLIMVSCATNVATSKPTNFEAKPISLNNPRNYEILGPVALEKNWFGILGVTTPSLDTLLGSTPMQDNYIWQAGGVTYLDIFEKAKITYPNVDAVVDITIDYTGTFYGIFYATRKNIVTGIAIRYVREPDVSSSAKVDLKLDIKE